MRLSRRIGADRSFSGWERDRLFVRLVPGKPLVDVGALSGADLVGDGRSAVAADFDGDGDLDLLVRQVGQPRLVLLRNDGPGGHSLEVRAEGRALGLNATVTATIGPRTFVRQVLAGSGFLTQEPAAVHVGLGDEPEAAVLEVKFLSGKVARAEHVPAGSLVIAHEATGALEVAPRPAPRPLAPQVSPDDGRALATPALLLAALTPQSQAARLGRRADAGPPRPLLINVWAPWCAPCARELPALSAWAAAHPEVEVLAVSLEGDDEAVAAGAKALGLTAPAAALVPGSAARLGLGGALPATFFYGADGGLRRGWYGALDFATFTAPAP